MIEPSNIQLKAITPIRITAFLGLNRVEDGDTELKLGEASDTQNFRITNGYEITKMEGWQDVFPSMGDKKIQGMWYGKLKGVYMLVFNYGGTLYKRVNGVNTSIGTVADARTTFFYFNSYLYILGGKNYKKYDGGTSILDVVGYIPKLAINAPPSGGGTPYEQVNMLTGSKHMTFSPDGTSKVFKLAEANITEVQRAEVNGSSTSNYTADLVNGTVTFNTAPTQGVGTVDIYWTKPNEDNRDAILECTDAFIFGGSADTRVFLYGNPKHPNREYFSGITTKADPEYFPANNYKDIGTNQHSITGMSRQYNTQLIFKENETYYASIESTYDATGMILTDFPAFPLNSVKGNIAQGQTRVLQNNPVSINNDGIYRWVSSNIRDERNAQKISQRLGREFEALDLSECITYDWEEKMEYWVCIPSKALCYIYNYGNDTWYTRTNVKAYSFITIDGELYFATDGTIRKFDKNNRYDGNFETIDAIYVTGFYGFNKEWLKKNIRKMWSAVKPETKVYVQYLYTTDNQDETVIGEVEYDVIDFSHIDFSHFTFNTSLTVKPFRFKLKAKKFAYFKLKIRSNKNIARATVVNVDLKETEGGEIK